MNSSMFSHNTLVTGGTFYQTNIISDGGFKRLQESASPAAFHDSADRRDPPKCHPRTRVAILEKIMNWIHGLDTETLNALIMWLHGPAGSGKSAIAQTIAEQCYKEGMLLGSYFFSRFDPTRNHARSIIATIAYQASQRFPSFKDAVLSVIDSDPLVFSRSLNTQMLNLIINPMRKLMDSGYFEDPKSTRVVIIDGLDECEDRDGQLEILDGISMAFQCHRLPLIFLIASRPELDISTAFGMGYLNDISTRLPLDDIYHASADITLFLNEKVDGIKQHHPFRASIPRDWPAQHIFEVLVSKSSGQFIYAATVIRFIQSSRHRPPHRLDIVLGIRPATTRDVPFAELDALYMHIFSSLPDPEPVIQILALYILTRSVTRVSVSEMEELLSLDSGDIEILLCDLTSILSIITTAREPRVENLFFLHASLEDFLLDRSRSHTFHIDSPSRNTEFAHLWFQRLNYIVNSQEGPPEALDDWFATTLTTLPNHIVNALPNPTLREEILDLPLSLIWRRSNNRNALGMWMQFIPDFLESVKKSKFADRELLYDHALRNFDQFAQKIMEIIYSEPSLTALVAIAGIKVENPRYFWPDYSLEHVFGVQSFGSSNPSNRGNELGFSVIYYANLFLDYLAFLVDFLHDEERSGSYILNGQKYAVAAVYLLKHTCNHLQQKHQFEATPYQHSRRRNSPWMWRKIRQARETGRQFLENKANKQRFRNFCKRKYTQGTPEVPHAFHLALLSLCYSLLRSDRSEELVSLAQRSAFGPLSRKFPRHTELARNHIKRYLARTEADLESF